jgi:hypothetical protein
VLLLVCFSNWGDASERRPFFLLDWAPMRAKELLLLSDWLNELAVFGNPKHFYDSETATHCAQVLKYRHLVVIAIEPLAGNKKGDAGVFYGQRSRVVVTVPKRQRDGGGNLR